MIVGIIRMDVSKGVKSLLRDLTWAVLDCLKHDLAKTP